MMGWKPTETRIERLRQKIGEDPLGARGAIEEAIGESPGPSDRTRLFGLLVASCKTLGDFGAAEEAWEEGKRQGGSSIARTELTLQAAGLFNAMARPEVACELAKTAQHLLEEPLRRPPGRSGTSQRRRRWIHTLKSWTFYYLGDASLGMGRSRTALAYGLQALRWADCRFHPQTYLGALSIVAAALVRGAGTFRDVVLILEHCKQATHLVQKRRKSIPKAKLRWIRAICLARLGATAAAESLLISVIRDLQALHAVDAAYAVADLIWVVEDRAGRQLDPRYGVRWNAMPGEARSEMPALDDPSSPIGF